MLMPISLFSEFLGNPPILSFPFGIWFSLPLNFPFFPHQKLPNQSPLLSLSNSNYRVLGFHLFSQNRCPAFRFWLNINMVMLNSSFAAWISRLFACMGGCFGCCTKPTPIIAVDEPSKGLRIQGRIVKKPSISDGFWSTSTCDLDNSTIQSQRSISSISTSNLTLNPSNVGGSTSNPSEFVNHGLLLWNQNRLQWTGSSSKTTDQTQQRRKAKISWRATYDSLLGTRQPFPHPIPLSEMVNFLVEVWEQEGLYD
ncbi:uncharacterized protein LOC111014486 [Momordica charantia]|uniref:Uncharacterized protein LOC111014486 n=1 Tax=Momordica charantia TaxID=3673 RepID=A0A6J1CTQ5_MOMCH|nr:uncharacterized protein LOC111014486 [Momordica charantia]